MLLAALKKIILPHPFSWRPKKKYRPHAFHPRQLKKKSDRTPIADTRQKKTPHPCFGRPSAPNFHPGWRTSLTLIFVKNRGVSWTLTSWLATLAHFSASLTASTSSWSSGLSGNFFSEASVINSFRSISSNFCYAEASTAVFTLNAQLSKDSARTLRRWSIEGSSSSVYRYLKQCLLGWHSHKYLALCIHTILLGLHGQVMAERKHVVLHSSHIRSSSGSSSKASRSASTVPWKNNNFYR